jgi:hypothetical protein
MSGIGRVGRAISLWVVVLSLAGAGLASATINNQKKAKELGFPATNCMYCHADKLPRKELSTLNDRGSWLKSEKEKRSAKEVDVAWLKDHEKK